MSGVEQRTFLFIVDVNQFSFESLQHPLCKQIKSNFLFKCLSGGQVIVCGVATHRLIKVHVVGDDLDIWVEDLSLAYHLFQDVSYSSREDEQGDAVLIQVVEEILVAVPVKRNEKESTLAALQKCFQHSRTKQVFGDARTSAWLQSPSPPRLTRLS